MTRFLILGCLFVTGCGKGASTPAIPAPVATSVNAPSPPVFRLSLADAVAELKKPQNGAFATREFSPTSTEGPSNLSSVGIHLTSSSEPPGGIQKVEIHWEKANDIRPDVHRVALVGAAVFLDEKDVSKLPMLKDGERVEFPHVSMTRSEDTGRISLVLTPK